MTDRNDCQFRREPPHTAFNRAHSLDSRRQKSQQTAMQSKLFDLLCRNLNEDDFIHELCEITRDVIESPLVLLLAKTKDNEWALRAISQNEPVGELEELCSYVTDNCSRAESSPVPLVLTYNSNRKPTRVSHVVVLPIRCRNGFTATIGICFESANAIPASIPGIICLADSLHIQQTGKEVREQEWKLEALASIVELTSELELASDFRLAVESCTNSLRTLLDCETVAFVHCDRDKAKLLSVSGKVLSDTPKDLKDGLIQTAREALLNGKHTVPSEDQGVKNLICLAHQSLSKKFESGFVGSFLIESITKTRLGVIVILGELDSINAKRAAKFMNAFAPRLGTTLHSKTLNRSIFRSKANTSNYSNGRVKLKGWVSALTILLLALTVFGALQIPVQYKIRSVCSVEPSQRRYITAPFAGVLSTSFVRPGDQVEQGQILAILDGKELQLKLAASKAEQHRTMIQREAEIKKNEIATAVQLELEFERLASEIAILEQQLQGLTLRSPIDGVVLSGDIEHLTDLGMGIGHILYEIAPKDHTRLVVDIDAIDRAYAKEGMKCTLWLSGYENASIQGTLKSFRPMSELRSGKNSFVAEVAYDNDAIELKPGMVGKARVDSIPCSLGWSLFHKPWWFLRSHLMLW